MMSLAWAGTLGLPNKGDALPAAPPELAQADTLAKSAAIARPCLITGKAAERPKAFVAPLFGVDINTPAFEIFPFPHLTCAARAHNANERSFLE
jgi:hypothetical protein